MGGSLFPLVPLPARVGRDMHPQLAPRILGHGIDLVEVPRIARMIAEHGERFLIRTYTARERETCQGVDPARPDVRMARRLASRFAAKEATFKALGTGLDHGMTWQDVEVLNLPSGQPIVHLTGVAAELAARKAIAAWHLSLTDTDQWAMASVIAEG